MAFDPEDFSWNYCPICGGRLVMRMDGDREQPRCDRCRRFYYRNPVPAVCCFITDNAGLLLAQRAVEPCVGEWTLPGGFVELGETTEEAIVREMREETTLEISDLHLVGVSTQQSRFYGAVTVLGYYVGSWRGDVKPCSDVLDLKFFSPAERPPLPFRAHVELVEMFDAFRAKRR